MVAAGSMVDGRERRAGFADAQESVESLGSHRLPGSRCAHAAHSRSPMLRSNTALSVTRISVPLSARMRRTSARESCGLSGTAMPPARMMARNQ